METLDKLRKKIDLIDEKLLKILAKRFEFSRRIGKLKESQGLPIIDKNREKDLLIRRKNDAAALNIDKIFIERFFKLILGESRRIQKNKH